MSFSSPGVTGDQVIDGASLWRISSVWVRIPDSHLRFIGLPAPYTFSHLLLQLSSHITMTRCDVTQPKWFWSTYENIEMILLFTDKHRPSLYEWEMVLCRFSNFPAKSRLHLAVWPPIIPWGYRWTGNLTPYACVLFPTISGSLRCRNVCYYFWFEAQG